MHWADSIAKALSHRGDKHVIASGITPSGEFHIGHLREILTSDMIKRACRSRGLEIEFVWFVDDADPLRKVYSFLDDSYEQYIGHQLANIPPPDLEGKPDYARFESGISYAKHFLSPFLEALNAIGVEIDDVIYNYDAYQNGMFAETARAACNNAEAIQEIIERVSGRELDEDWFPWNPVDSNGSMDGIRITGWDDPFVSWIDSEGNIGQSDVTKGDGKLPWRIDWPAKWVWRGITMEPFGKDHGAAGGSYDTGKEICRLLGKEPPYPTTYEWISLKGVGAMSSSTGVSIGPLDALQLVPPEILRYLIARNQPKKHIEFDTGSSLIELADEYQRKLKTLEGGPDDDWDDLSRRQQNAWLVTISQIAQSAVSSDFGIALSEFSREMDWDEEDKKKDLRHAMENLSGVSFRHLSLLAQLHEDDVDVWDSLLRSKLIRKYLHTEFTVGYDIPESLPDDTILESISPGQNIIVQSNALMFFHLPLRLKLMRNWIASPHFPEPFRLRIQSEISEGAKQNMDPRDIDYLQALTEAFTDCEWNWKTINNHVCELAKGRDMKLRDAFQLMYWIVLDQDFGPKLASILEEMDRQAVLDLLQSAIDELSS